MSSISEPNWLTVSAALFLLAGLAILVRTASANSALSVMTEPTFGSLRDSQRRVAMRFGLPMLITGAILHALGQLATSTLTPLIAFMLLALALALVIYVSVEDLLADQLESASANAERSAPILSLAPPKPNDGLAPSQAHELQSSGTA